MIQLMGVVQDQVVLAYTNTMHNGYQDYIRENHVMDMFRKGKFVTQFCKREFNPERLKGVRSLEDGQSKTALGTLGVVIKENGDIIYYDNNLELFDKDAKTDKFIRHAGKVLAGNLSDKREYWFRAKTLGQVLALSACAYEIDMSPREKIKRMYDLLYMVNWLPETYYIASIGKAVLLNGITASKMENAEEHLDKFFINWDIEEVHVTPKHDFVDLQLDKTPVWNVKNFLLPEPYSSDINYITKSKL